MSYDTQNTKNLRSKAIKFMAGLDDLTNKLGLVLSIDDFVQGAFEVTDKDGNCIISEMKHNGIGYRGFYMEALGMGKHKWYGESKDDEEQP